jgi:hypothetical protein
MLKGAIVVPKVAIFIEQREHYGTTRAKTKPSSLAVNKKEPVLFS